MLRECNWRQNGTIVNLHRAGPCAWSFVYCRDHRLRCRPHPRGRRNSAGFPLIAAITGSDRTIVEREDGLLAHIATQKHEGRATCLTVVPEMFGVADEGRKQVIGSVVAVDGAQAAWAAKTAVQKKQPTLNSDRGPHRH